MKDIYSYMQIFIVGAGGFIGGILGGWDGFLYALIAMVLIDYLTGVLAAAVTGNLSSREGFRGIARKIMIFCLVAVASILDTRVIGQGGAIRTAVIFFYISNEGISILENAERVGGSSPPRLLAVFKKLLMQADELENAQHSESETEEDKAKGNINREKGEIR